MKPLEFSVLGPLMGGFGSQAFMGCVHEDHGVKPAVLVFLPDEIVDDVDLFRRVWHETEFGSLIDHINVIGVMGLARLDEGYARVVDYADAESLRSVFRRATTVKKPIPAAIATAIVADACMGVHYAHELGLMEQGHAMIHGGLRPETLLVSFKGMGKVTGYGTTTLAEVMQKSRRGDQSHDAYTAPEQAFGGRAAATVQTDVYALGCVLYEALTGKQPFAADNDLADAMIKDELSKPSLSGVTEDMARVVLHATKRRSKERFESPLDMRHELLEHCEPASETEVRRFMDELFPPDTVPRATRDQMIIAARERVPKPTGRLLVEMPAELARAPAARSAPPSDLEIEAATGRVVARSPTQAPPLDISDEAEAIVDDEPSDPGRANRAAEALVNRVNGRQTAPPSSQAESTGPRQPVPSTIPRPAAPPSWQADPTLPPQPAYNYAPPAPPPRQSPALLLGLGLAVGVAAALALVMFNGSGKKEVVVVQAPAPPPPPPVAPPPPPPPDPEPPLVPIPPANPTPDAGAGAKKVAKVEDKGPGTLVVQANPASLNITVDGKAVGTGSATVELPAGKHTVVGVDAGLGIRVTRVVRLKGGGTETVDLEARKGTLAIEAPDGCTVVIGGKTVGKTPMAPVELFEGTHNVVVKKGGVDYRHKVPIKGGLEAFLQVQFSDG